MKSWLRMGAVMVLLCGSKACATAQQVQHAPVLTAEQWREDLRYFAKELEKRHKNLYHTVSREQFERAVRELDAAIPSLQTHQIIVRMKQIAATVGDGHTGLHVPAYFGFYPIAVYWFGSELRVTAATREYDRALGARVVAIGGLDITEVDRRVRTCFPSATSENEWYAMNISPAFLTRPEILHALGVVPALEAASFTLQHDDGTRFDLNIAPIPPPPVVNGTVTLPGFVSAAKQQPLFRQRPGERFWFTFLPESQTVYVSFRGYDGLRANAQALFRFIDSNPTRRLVIDMRQNGGGDFLQGRQHLVRPLKERSTLNREGALYVIVGRRTFSAAMANAIDFRKETHATLVGEPIGERPNSYSENDEMTLPNSRLVVSYSTRFYQFLDEDVPAVLPDIRIDPTWPDFLAGRDAVLEWILSVRLP